MNPEVLFVLLPGGDPSRLDVTIDSIRAEAGRDAQVVSLVPDQKDLPFLEAVEALRADQLLSFARPGDRLVPGALATRAMTFSAYPGAAISFAGHRIVDSEGEALREVKAPPPGTDPDLILLRPAVEAAATIVRASALEARHLELLSRMHGDVVAWSKIAHDEGMHISGEVAVEVPLDSQRHGFDPAARVEGLLVAFAASDGAETSRDPELRRDLLRRIYLEPDGAERLIDLAEVFAAKLQDPDSAAAVIADLQWLAERQAEALKLERLRWAEGEVPIDDKAPLTVSEEIIEAHATLAEMGIRTHEMAAIIRRLQHEVYRRDVIIANVAKMPLGEALASAPEGVES